MTLEKREATEVGVFLQPEVVLENARIAAKALASVISQKPKPVMMNEEQYLEFDDWQLCGQFYGYTVKTGDAVPVEIDGVKGAKANADLIDFKTGAYVGGAEAYCMRDEEHWNTRPKYEWRGEGKDRKRVKVGDEVVPWFQLASMAQTRAGAKAFRNRLAWVVVLAGYRATPAEEMTESTVRPVVEEKRTVDTTEHYCQVHKINFFKSAKMRSYAHKIEGTDEWCNETEPKPSQIAPQSKSGGIETKAGENSQAVDSHIDLEWLKTQLGVLQGKGVPGWSNKEVVEFLNGITHAKAATVREAVATLSKEQSGLFCEQVQEALNE